MCPYVDPSLANRMLEAWKFEHKMYDIKEFMVNFLNKIMVLEL